MTHAEFRRKQREMDDAGFITHIRHICTKKIYLEAKGYFRYKYRYEVIVNGQILSQCKTRRTAKSFLIEYCEAKKEFDSAHKRLLKTCNKLKEQSLRNSK